MAKKKETGDEWLSGNEAANILTANSGHTVSANYVRVLARKGEIKWRRKDGRTNEYHRGDVTAYRVTPKTKADRESASSTEGAEPAVA